LTLEHLQSNLFQC